ADIFISAHYWDPRSPKLFSLEDVAKSDFKMSVIADITCDMNGSVPTTLRASTIASPFYGFNPKLLKEDVPFSKETITIMAVDNLPCELPRDASDDFGKDLMERVLPSIINSDSDGIIDRASICKNGELTSQFSYLKDYAYQ
ncbi:MAG: alanine dehydrogenase, partial [Bacteroidota bacterium]